MGVVSSEATSSMEPGIGLDASRLDLYEQTDSSGENNWANIWFKEHSQLTRYACIVPK